MFRATDKQLQTVLECADGLSIKYAQKFPEIGKDEFYSISLLAIAEALHTYRKEKSTLKTWCFFYITSRFNDYLRKQKKKNQLLFRISNQETRENEKRKSADLER